MGVCRVCNGLTKKTFKCPKCQSILNDYGRVMDYYDNYSAYMDIDQLKMEDGFPTSYKEEFCPHLYRCPICTYEGVRLLKE